MAAASSEYKWKFVIGQQVLYRSQVAPVRIFGRRLEQVADDKEPLELYKVEPQPENVSSDWLNFAHFHTFAEHIYKVGDYFTVDYGYPSTHWTGVLRVEEVLGGCVWSHHPEHGSCTFYFSDARPAEAPSPVTVTFTAPREVMRGIARVLLNDIDWRELDTKYSLPLGTLESFYETVAALD